MYLLCFLGKKPFPSFIPEVYAESSQTFKMDFFTKIVNGINLLTVSPKSSILDF